MPFTILTTIRDAKGEESTTEYNFPASYDFDDMVLFAQQNAERIDALIKGKVVRIGIAYKVSTAGLTIKSVPDPDSDVEEGARFQFLTEDGNLSSMRLATFSEDLIVSGTKNVDLTDGDVDDFVSAMVDGAPVVALGGVLSPCDKREEDIDSLEFAVEAFTKSR